MKLSSMNFFHSPALSSLVGPDNLTSTLLSDTLNLNSSLRVRDQISHPHKTTNKIMVPYILLFRFLLMVYPANVLPEGNMQAVVSSCKN
jgi:hypothetical protein